MKPEECRTIMGDASWSCCRRGILLVGPAHDNPERVVRQWRLQSGRILNPVCDYGVRDNSVPQIALATESNCLACDHNWLPLLAPSRPA